MGVWEEAVAAPKGHLKIPKVVEVQCVCVAEWGRLGLPLDTAPLNLGFTVPGWELQDSP